jgi:hypothetical protein
MGDMALQPAIEIILAAAALALLGRDLYRAWADKLRRPMTLVVAGLMVVLLAGTLGSRAHPHPWWLLLPGAILTWEVARGCGKWCAGGGARRAATCGKPVSRRSPSRSCSLRSG